MARRVFLHVGTMKSATSYLQKLFDANQERLRSHGLLWQRSQRNLYAFHEFNGSPRLPPSAKGIWKEFHAELRDEPGDVLLSMELLAKATPEQARRIARTLAAEDLQVIITARDLTKVAPSHWQETTQNTGTTPWMEWIGEICGNDPEAEEPLRFWRNHYLPSIVESWAAASPSKIHVVTVPQSRTDPRLIWKRFASVIGVPADDFVEPRFSNPAIGATSAELMRRLNTELSGLPYQAYRRGFKAALAKQTLAKRAHLEPRPALDRQQHERLRQVALAMVEKIQKADVEIVGDINDIIPAEEPSQPPYDPASATDAELLEVAMVGLAELGTRVGRQRLDIERLQRQVDGGGVPSPQRRTHGADGLGSRLTRRLVPLVRRRRAPRTR
jgi:hypothetical protein